MTEEGQDYTDYWISKALGNIGPAVRTTIQGIGNRNPDTISSGCVVSSVSMILPLGKSFLSAWEGSWNPNVRLYITRGNCERRSSGGNSVLILRAERSGWWIKIGIAEPFSTEMRNGI